jgi:hypothetical protein
MGGGFMGGGVGGFTPGPGDVRTADFQTDPKQQAEGYRGDARDYQQWVQAGRPQNGLPPGQGGKSGWSPNVGIGQMPTSGPIGGDMPPMMQGQPVQRTPPMGGMSPQMMMFRNYMNQMRRFQPQQMPQMPQGGLLGQPQRQMQPGMGGGGFGGWRGMPRSGPTY